MQRDAEKCREMQRDAEKCRGMQRKAEIYNVDTYAIGPCRDFIADAADEPANGNEYGSEGDIMADVAVEPADGN